MHSEKDYFFSLLTVKGLGPARIKKLFETFGSGQNIWRASPGQLSAIDGFNEKSAQYLFSRLQESKIVDTGGNTDHDILCLSDGGYPKNLFNIYDPPPVIYCRGNISCAGSLAVSVVGTRCPGRYGLDVTASIVKGLAESGITVVSGLAAGIDSQAHRSAMEYGGSTVAVLGTGIDTVYPGSNAVLAGMIERNGCLMSEHGPGSLTDRWSFPRRNRIISGLSLGTVVIEGGLKSGALITADFALEQGREVFAVPGPVDRQTSAGPNKLIKEGAKLVQDIDDILAELNLMKGKADAPAPVCGGLSAEEADLMSYINERKHFDRIQHETALRADALSALLLGLEMKNAIRELPGKIFAPCYK